MISFLSFRYAFSSSSHQRSRAIRAIVTIALSLTALTVVMSIMEFLQNGRFEDIRDVRSFDIIVEGRHKEELSSLFPESSVFEYGEGEALSDKGAFSVRYIDSDYDGGLNILLGDADTLLVPYSLFRSSGGELTLSMLKKGKAATTMKTSQYNASGIYWTELGSEFDDSTIFLPISGADEIVYFYTAIKNVDAEKAKETLTTLGYKAQTWKEQESSLYAAFLLEKSMMYGVLSLLFVIIMVSLKEAIRIFVSTREKEAAELEILGMKKDSLLVMNYCAFFIILALGILLGGILGKISLIAVEYISKRSDAIMDMNLSMSAISFLVFSLLLFLLTILCVYLENRKRNKKPLWEVIHVK